MSFHSVAVDSEKKTTILSNDNIMDWKEFKKLPPHKQIEIFNSANAEIKNLAETCESLGFKKSTVQSHFTKVLNCSFNKNLGQYIPNEVDNSIEVAQKESKEPLRSAQTKDDNSITSKGYSSTILECKLDQPFYVIKPCFSYSSTILECK